MRRWTLTVDLMTAPKVAIIGPGLMGQGIARVMQRAGWPVLLLGREATVDDAGLRVLADCDLAIETVPEDRALKTQLLGRLQRALPAHALLASNTSGLPIGGLGAGLADPGRFLGLHFFSPVERMRLVEVVAGAETGEAAVQQALAWMQALGQAPVRVRDGPGFFTSRVFAAYLDEAVAMVGEGVEVARIEAAGLALGRAIGPLALLDQIGLRLNLQQARQALADGLPARFCRPLALPVLARLVAAGRCGRREGGGFFDRRASGERQPWPGLPGLFPLAPAQPDAMGLQARLRWVEVLEALRCLEEGVLANADDADTASLLGLGFPAATGGVLRWAEGLGLASLVATADRLAAAHGSRFEASAWLRERAGLGQGLQAWRQAAAPATHPSASPPTP